MHHSTFDVLPVTHAKQIQGIPGTLDPVTDEDWATYGGWVQDLPQIRREAAAILASITPEQEALLKAAVRDRRIDMHRLQNSIRDQALS